MILRAVRELLGFIGVGLIAYGLWSIYEPLGFIAVGIALIAQAFALSLRKKVP